MRDGLDDALVKKVARGLCDAWASDPARASSWLPLSSMDAMARYALGLAERAAKHAVYRADSEIGQQWTLGAIYADAVRRAVEYD